MEIKSSSKTRRSSDNANIHIRLITGMVNKLMSEGYKVSADHIGFPNGKPREFNEFVPDIYAEKGTEKIIIEAETCDSLDSVDAKLQWIAFSSVPDVSFSVIIPSKCLKEAKKLANKWGVKPKTFWVMDIK